MKTHSNIVVTVSVNAPNSDLKASGEIKLDPNIGKPVQTEKNVDLETKVSNILKDLLLKAIYTSIKDPVSRNIIDHLKTSHPEFRSKNKLCRNIMLDMRKKGNFDDFLMYIREPHKALKSWVEKYVSDYCMERDSDDKSLIGKKANEMFRNNVLQVIECVKEASESNEITFEDWLQRFNNTAEEIISISDNLFDHFGRKEVQVMDINYFTTELIKSLDDLKISEEKVLDGWELKELKTVTKQPHVLISESLLGCTAVCPFCKIMCSQQTDIHPGTDHTAPSHFPGAIWGVYDPNTKELDLPTCNEVVASDDTFRNRATEMMPVKYKDYRSMEAYASWSIAADTSLEANLYWKWVVANFTQQIVQYWSKDYLEDRGYEVKCTNIPSEWKNMTEEEADESIRIMFQ
ncbi:unnamed protein product [Meganyctiphanes norvegica]|uniref:Interferon-induced very large GTPase 1-like n=1 Tax=Meganyctiphanes norvegica TaxID=48144 RepID=A0AAV2QJK4_MEGNR